MRTLITLAVILALANPAAASSEGPAREVVKPSVTVRDIVDGCRVVVRLDRRVAYLILLPVHNLPPDGSNNPENPALLELHA
jgi:hypothetical protein